MTPIRAISIAISAAAALVALGDVALASECHRSCDGGYLAATALMAGSLALGSAALGVRLGGSAMPKRSSAADLGSTDPEPPDEPADAPAPGGIDGAKLFTASTDYAAKVAKEMGPRGQAMESGLGVVQRVVANEDRVAGLAEGLTDAAQDQVKDVVKDAVKVTPPTAEAIPSPSVGTTPRYCPSCGTKTRENARFCGQCGTRLS